MAGGEAKKQLPPQSLGCRKISQNLLLLCRKKCLSNNAIFGSKTNMFFGREHLGAKSRKIDILKHDRNLLCRIFEAVCRKMEFSASPRPTFLAHDEADF